MSNPVVFVLSFAIYKVHEDGILGENHGVSYVRLDDRKVAGINHLGFYVRVRVL